MDGTEDSPYLTIFQDAAHNYLLETSDETLGIQDPTLDVEPMFTDIEDANGAWSVGLPNFMNDNLITEDNEIERSMSLSAEVPVNFPTNNIDPNLATLYNESVNNPEQSLHTEKTVDYPIEQYNTENVMTNGGMFINDEILLHLSLGNDTTPNGDLPLVNNHDFEASIDTVTQSFASRATAEEDVLVDSENLASQTKVLNEIKNYDNGNHIQTGSECLSSAIDVINNSENIIRLLNTDGTIININKELLNLPISKEQNVDLNNVNVEEYIEVVIACKCKICSFLCEKQEDVTEHLKTQHLIPKEDSLEQKTAEHELNEESDLSEHKNKPENWKSLILQSKLQKQQTEERVTNIIEHWQTTIPQKSPNEEISSSLVTNKIQEESQTNGIMKDSAGNEVKLKSILKNGTQEMVYICSECNLGFANKEKLRHHMILVHKLVQKPTELETNGNLSNDTKNSGKKSKLTIALIQRQARASKKIKCSVKGCELRFAMDEMRIRHEKCHVEGQKKQFKCFECNSKFSLWRICSMHMWKCHNVDLGLYTCPMCSVFKVSSPLRLMNHMAIHEEEKPFLCNVCGKSFKQHTQLRNHQVIHKGADEVPDWATQQQCEICKKYFANSKCLKKHIQCVHDKFKPFICNICGHKTGRKAMLNLHLRQHTGEKPHKCPICEFRTGDHNSLRRHMMRHSGNTKYSCPHCDYQSIQSTAYKNHVATKHPGLGGSFFCSICSYHTVNENTYMSHIADHKNGLIKCTDDEDNEDNTITINSEDNINTCLNYENRTKQQNSGDIEDDETQTYLSSMMDHSNDAIDTGGITIPAGLELQVPH